MAYREFAWGRFPDEDDFVTVRLSLSEPIPETDTDSMAATWEHLSVADAQPSCTGLAPTDSVIVGTLTLDGQAGSAPLEMAFPSTPAVMDSTVDVGVGYADSSTCAPADSSGEIIRPDLSEGTWGPVPVMFVVHGADAGRLSTSDQIGLRSFPVMVTWGRLAHRPTELSEGDLTLEVSLIPDAELSETEEQATLTFDSVQLADVCSALQATIPSPLFPQPGAEQDRRSDALSLECEFAAVPAEGSGLLGDDSATLGVWNESSDFDAEQSLADSEKMTSCDDRDSSIFDIAGYPAYAFVCIGDVTGASEADAAVGLDEVTVHLHWRAASDIQGATAADAEAALEAALQALGAL